MVVEGFNFTKRDGMRVKRLLRAIHKRFGKGHVYTTSNEIRFAIKPRKNGERTRGVFLRVRPRIVGPVVELRKAKQKAVPLTDETLLAIIESLPSFIEKAAAS